MLNFIFSRLKFSLIIRDKIPYKFTSLGCRL